MQAQMAIQKLLTERLSEAQAKNPGFSIRAFSTRVGVHFAALSAILAGKRNVSRKLATRIADRLYLDPQERAELLALFPEPKASARRGVSAGEVLAPTYLQLNAQQFRVAAEWEHFAVLSLLQCSEFRSEIEWIARRLALTEARAKAVVSRLLELGLLTIDADGVLSRSEKNYRTPDDTADVSLKKCHEQTLELARESLYRDSVTERDFTSVTVAVDPKNLRTAKEMIRKFQDDLCDRLEDGTRTEVYRLSVQLFPLSTLSAKAERKSS
jgi:uncharacterized protein (TIGR02147 family)